MEERQATAAEPRADDAGPLGISDRDRFIVELEFVQCLANPAYLNWLAQNRYLEDPAFLRFLKYLDYWRQPQYSRFIIYPHCLAFLDLLQLPEFRTAIANPNYKELVHSQQYFHWQHFRANREREGGGQEGAGQGGAAQLEQQRKEEEQQQQEGKGE